MQRATGVPAAEENGRLRVWLFLVLVYGPVRAHREC
jgi:hypothetical protein